MNDSIESINDRIINEKFKMIKESKTTFFGNVFAQLQIEINFDITETACVQITDKGCTINMFFNPNFISKLSNSQLQTLIVHEIYHIINEHFYRGGKRNSYLWNVATDLAINSELNKNHFEKIDGWLMPYKYNLPDLQSADYYYNELKKRQQNCDNEKTIDDHSCWDKIEKDKKNKCDSNDNNSNKLQNGQINSQTNDNTSKINGADNKNNKEKINREYRKLNRLEESNIKYRIDDIIKSAYKETERMQGNIPSNIKDIIDILLKPAVVNWKKVLKNQVQCSVKNKHRKSYLRPSRRYTNEKFIFKGKVPDRIAKIIVAIDTSGSIGQDDFNAFMNEIYDLHKQYPIELRIIQCDAQVQSDKIYKKNGKIKSLFYGRGGTDFRPVFDYIKEKKYRPNLLIYFTDGYGSYPSNRPKYKVFWCVVGNNYNLNYIPFGIKVKLDKNIK